MARTTTKASPVETRFLSPQVPNDEERANGHTPSLFDAAPQIQGDVPMTIDFIVVTPEQADEWLRHADLNGGKFRQRPTRVQDVQRWQNLMLTDRFIQFLPDGPLCFDDDGILLNGKHRMTALAGLTENIEGVGFMRVQHVPRWMFAYFDTGRVRTLRDVFAINSRMTGAQTGSTMRHAMRYEEFIRGIRPPIGWREWGSVRDEHADVDAFFARRQDLADWFGLALKVQKSTKIIVASLMVFHFYQSLAWPDGAEQIAGFIKRFDSGSDLGISSPTLKLREWSKETAATKERISAKRELHTMLLFRTFGQDMQRSRIQSANLTWAYGMPMTMPYHPDGPDVAVTNVKKALAELDQVAPT